MISVVVPTLDAAATLPACLDSLMPGLSVIKEVIVSDGGSSDATVDVADAAGARLVSSPKGRGHQLAAGAAAARAAYLLFLHADTTLEASWPIEAERFMATGGDAATFTLAFRTDDVGARIVAAGAMLRTRIFKLPYGDQALLVAAPLYHALGGYRPLPIMEDVDFIERLVRARGRGALRVLRTRAVTSADRYRRGYARRVLRNAWLIAQYRAGVDPERLARNYARS